MFSRPIKTWSRVFFNGLVFVLGLVVVIFVLVLVLITSVLVLMHLGLVVSKFDCAKYVLLLAMQDTVRLTFQIGSSRPNLSAVGYMSEIGLLRDSGLCAFMPLPHQLIITLVYKQCSICPKNSGGSPAGSAEGARVEAPQAPRGVRPTRGSGGAS